MNPVRDERVSYINHTSYAQPGVPRYYHHNEKTEVLALPISNGMNPVRDEKVASAGYIHTTNKYVEPLQTM